MSKARQLAVLFLLTQAWTLSAETNQLQDVLAGQTLYVDDHLWVTVRQTPASDGERIAVIQSGTKMTLLQHDKNADYAKVRLESGASGWILFRYLTDTEVAATKLIRLKKDFDQLSTLHNKTKESLNDIKKEQRNTTQENKQLQQTIVKLKNELEEITQISGDAITNFNEKRRLEQEVTTHTDRIKQLSIDNESLRSNLYLYSGIAGITSLLLGLYIGTIPIRRDRRWRKMT